MMAANLERRSCSPTEISFFRDHMAGNSATGGWALEKLANGAALSVEVVAGIEAIAELTTFFKNIGAAISSARTGDCRFRVRHAVGLLELPEYKKDRAVAEMRTKVLRYRRLFDGPGSSPVVTLVQFTDALIVLDRNHTIMAAYLYALEHPARPYALSVFILGSTDSIEVLG